MKGCDICLVLKAIWHKPYSNLQFLLVLIYLWKDLSIDFVIGIPSITDWKGDSYDSIFIIINWFTKMVYYMLVKITIDTPSLAKLIIEIVVKHHSLLNSIVIYQELLFIAKFQLLLCYFLCIKQKLSTVFYLQTDDQIKRLKNMIKVYFSAFVNFE